MFHSGYVAIVGVPNVGKSTLINRLIGEKVSIVTRKPQTTRHRILGILNQPHAQILFLDTPGIHHAKQLLNEKIVEAALASIKDADVIVHMIFPKLPINEEDQRIFKKCKAMGKPYLVIINRVDDVKKEELLPLMNELATSWQPSEIIPLSALTGEGCEVLLPAIEKNLPEGPPYYPTDQYTEHNLRFFCEEIVREKALKLLHQEIPYGMAAHVEKFEEEDGRAKINIAIIVEKKSHKGMVIGHQGHMIKKIGTLARQDMEKLLGKKVFLELFVKVVEGWTRDPKKLREYGIVR